MRDRKTSGNAVLRAAFVAVSLLFQVGWLLLLILELNEYSVWISLATSILSAALVLKLNARTGGSSMKMPWIMLILTFPVMGLSLYLLFEILRDPGVGKRMKQVRREMEGCIPSDAEAVLRRMEGEDLSTANQHRYLWKNTRWPVYENTGAEYFAEAVDAFERMKEDLKKAEDFIFMEYFIVEDSTSFWELEEILVEKAKQGVDVRLMYDDIGSVGYVNMLFAKRLNDQGVKCLPFNPALPVLNLFMNHRDHRKITVIDGKVGYTGGFNLADAYFDRVRPYGKWKDTGLRLEGEAVRSLTAAFLELWALQSREKEDYGRFLNVIHKVTAEGFVQPFADNPMGEERAAENVYLNLIAQADRSLYFITPYLIITDELSRSLRLAAKRGVDVRIITPGIPDKKTVYAVTRSYYEGLIRDGVRIFEYTPGFCHAKQCICDGKIVSVGTSNLDYRSLYHHFENNVLISGGPVVKAVAEDFEAMFDQCEEVTGQYQKGRGTMLRTWQYILRLFAPLL